MNSLYTKPLRVYVILGALALWGIWSGLKLPISLFPNSNEVLIAVDVPYGSYSSQQFFDLYGQKIESSLQGIKSNSIPVKELRAEYRNQNTQYLVRFDWGADPDKALNDISNLVRTHLSSAGDEILRGLRVNSWSDNRGFFAVSFYSPLHSLDEVYQILEPLISPIQSQIEDAASIGLWNPAQKEISIALIPEKLALYELKASQIQKVIQNGVTSLNGGTLKIGEEEYLLNLPKNLTDLQSLSQLRVSEPGKPALHLKDVANISYGVSKNNRRKFKTSGVESLILFGDPKEGGNIKRMSDQILEHLKILEKKWPSDIQYKILVNPSEFINSSIEGVIHEVFLAALLAVIVLFLFIGSLKNVITAAIEIPLSLLMAFILMRFSGMNLNLISLGGLALSAGMNVDASVVVLENIIRHFEINKKNLNYNEKLKVLIQAVNEVKIPIIASTISSLVVFLPLIFTEGLTHALLGDLAKAVIFSHGLSAFVALILVPTIRLHLISKGLSLESHSPFEKYFRKLENFYKISLSHFLDKKVWQKVVGGFLILLIPLLIYFVLPRLETEVIGKPESDWLMIGINAPAFSSMKEMESELDILEERINQNFKNEYLYTFTQIQGPNNGNIMVRIKDKKRIYTLIEKSEELFKNSTTKFYWVDYWNPSELSIPDPPHWRVEILGGNPLDRQNVTLDIKSLLLEKGIFDQVRTQGLYGREKEIKVQAHSHAEADRQVLSTHEISFLLRIINSGVYVDQLQQNLKSTPIYLRWAKEDVKSLETLKAIPIGFEGRILPLSALTRIEFSEREPRIYRENQQDMYVISGRLNKSHLSDKKEKVKQADMFLAEFKSKHNKPGAQNPIITEVQADKQLREALKQLQWAIIISIALVFLTMLIQLGDVIHASLVLVAIPLGFIGVLISLFIFKSTLSLNSGLGTILLNGIAVANSIILVDFIKKLFEEGQCAKEATINAATARLRPILMTSLTTVLGMLPIAFGFGDGGKILQPLGIAVCGGLWISMLLTLYAVPTLQYLYLSRQKVKK